MASIAGDAGAEGGVEGDFVGTGVRQIAELVAQLVGERGEVVLEKVSGNATRGREIVRRLRGKGSVAMTTEQILALTRKD